MSRRPKRLVVLVVAAALCVPLVTGPASAAPQQPADYYIGVSGVDLKEGQTYTPEEIRKLQAEAKPATMHRSAAPLTSAPDSTDAVASGFVLFNPGFRRSDFVYDSDWGKAILVHCSGTCTAESTYETQLHQYLYGGSSKRWQLTLNIRYKSGTNASSFGYWYGCAINVSGRADHYCLNGASASEVSGSIQPGGQLNRLFEDNSYPNKEYPMVGISVHWSGRASAENKDRGYDVCTGDNTKLCTSSGTG
jgi:hypothetical protein